MQDCITHYVQGLTFMTNYLRQTSQKRPSRKRQKPVHQQAKQLPDLGPEPEWATFLAHTPKSTSGLHPGPFEHFPATSRSLQALPGYFWTLATTKKKPQVPKNQGHTVGMATKDNHQGTRDSQHKQRPKACQPMLGVGTNTLTNHPPATHPHTHNGKGLAPSDPPFLAWPPVQVSKSSLWKLINDTAQPKTSATCQNRHSKGRHNHSTTPSGNNMETHSSNHREPSPNNNFQTQQCASSLTHENNACQCRLTHTPGEPTFSLHSFFWVSQVRTLHTSLSMLHASISSNNHFTPARLLTCFHIHSPLSSSMVIALIAWPKNSASLLSNVQSRNEGAECF